MIDNGNQGGLGIGLTLAKQLVEMHGGSIEAHSDGEGQGAEFAIHLPLAVVTGPRREQQRPPAGHGQPARVKVLVVDDNVDLVEMLSMVVESAGHAVRKAFDGRSGISAALEYQPDLILLDIGMPDMNGAEGREGTPPPSRSGRHTNRRLDGMGPGRGSPAHRGGGIRRPPDEAGRPGTDRANPGRGRGASARLNRSRPSRPTPADQLNSPCRGRACI